MVVLLEGIHDSPDLSFGWFPPHLHVHRADGLLVDWRVLLVLAHDEPSSAEESADKAKDQGADYQSEPAAIPRK